MFAVINLWKTVKQRVQVVNALWLYLSLNLKKKEYPVVRAC